jgi:hypothetical protein
MEVDTMKPFFFFTVVFLLAGICSVAAQDLIILRDGDIIEAKVMELSPAEIKYKRFDHLDGPTVVIPANNVLSIRYENGRVEIINADPTNVSKTTANDPNRFRFGINANAGGALGYIWGGASGAAINIELGKGNFNSEINLIFPIGGFGSLFTFNGFWPSKIGGFYLGGGIGFSFFETYGVIGAEGGDSSGYSDSYGNYHSGDSYSKDIYDYYTAFSLPVGLNIGYKFVTKSGLYFRTGAFASFDFGFLWDDNISPFYIKPDLAIGWTMR